MAASLEQQITSEIAELERLVALTKESNEFAKKHGFEMRDNSILESRLWDIEILTNIRVNRKEITQKQADSTINKLKKLITGLQ